VLLYRRRFGLKELELSSDVVSTSFLLPTLMEMPSPAVPLSTHFALRGTSPEMRCAAFCR
jgi:hypothetical protein